MATLFFRCVFFCWLLGVDQRNTVQQQPHVHRRLSHPSSGVVCANSTVCLFNCWCINPLSGVACEAQASYTPTFYQDAGLIGHAHEGLRSVTYPATRSSNSN